MAYIPGVSQDKLEDLITDLILSAVTSWNDSAPWGTEMSMRLQPTV